jgi:hypothetical protein
MMVSLRSRLSKFPGMLKGALSMIGCLLFFFSIIHPFCSTSLPIYAFADSIPRKIGTGHFYWSLGSLMDLGSVITGLTVHF